LSDDECLAAASTTSAVIVWRWLISRTRWIWAKRRAMRRKLALVIRVDRGGGDGFGVGEALDGQLGVSVDQRSLPVPRDTRTG
jgi:hypothetical protein